MTSYVTVECLIFLMFFCFASNPATCSINEVDLRALLLFKENIVDSRGVLDSWRYNGTANYCTWKGISCSSMHRRVVSIDLDSQGLVGSLSPHLGNLSFLRRINLQNNSFHGPIPQELGRLRRLEYLELSNNTFDGQIPRNLSQCRNLNFLNLIDNKLMGNVPFELSSLLKLEVLALAKNNISGTIPSFIGNFTFLRLLSLRDCGFHGQIPESLVRLRNLNFFSLAQNRFTGRIPSGLYNISTIHHFSVYSNQLQGNVPFDIGLTLPNLRFFSLASNNFSGFLPVSLSNASFLEYISLSENSFTGPMPKNIGRLPDLWGLNIWLANIQDDISFISSLTNCTKLRILDIYGNNFTGLLPQSIANLSTQLIRLSMGMNLIQGTIPSGIGNLIDLGYLNLESNLFSGPIPSSIGGLTKLQEIYLSANKFTDELPYSLGNLTLLNLLQVNRNNILGSIPPSLGNCSNLLVLDLSNNNFSGPIPEEIVSLSSISIHLDLSNNNLSGSIPFEIGSLSNLRKLDLSNNRLSGRVPRTISSCISLQQLNLDGNSFHGQIPQGLSSLTGLQELDLSRNKFSGLIPNFLGELSLEKLNISFNKLQGPVPIDGVFQNVSAVSLEENTELCGGISELKLPPCAPTNPKKKNSQIPLKIIVPVSVCGAIFIVIIAFSYIFIQRKTKSRDNLHATPFESQFPRLSYADLLTATDGFSEANMIGSGRFGSVYKGSIDNGNTTVAVKVLKLNVRGAHKSFTRECNVLRGLRHRNLLKILSISVSIDYQGNDFMALIYQFKANGSLDKWLHLDADGRHENMRYLTLMQRLNIAIDVASAVEYLHNGTDSAVVHGDLKPSNILLDDDMTAHVGDFGLAKVISNVSSGLATAESHSVAIKGTIGYIAPEYGMAGTVSIQGDVYSYGILLLELFTNIRPTSDVLISDHASLHNFVATKLELDRVMEIVDPLILQKEHHMINSSIRGCVASILGIGVACSRDLHQDRMVITDVVSQLGQIRMTVLAQGLRPHN
ncbi:putative receptor-like protein kinase At3g47110 [Sesamum indicum]|uniref:non-specific serine/threonine protein kinase n=1 Tax=Sesamum indicum TaxID=4182 RepID=A0A8M8UVJ3_SESIN|nr:putative receptor-like protein kinase At3g47110 [Sesamum indicum]